MVRADRDEDDGLPAAGVASQSWDAVIDVSRQPGQVRRAVRDLVTRHWVFVSSGNVYRGFDTLEQDESAPLTDALDGDIMTDMSVYGPAKVACEEAVGGAPGSATIVRSGLIGGPGDWSGRTGYYPWRFAHSTGPDVLVPPDPEFPCALVDVDDLAAWIVHVASERIDGTFNATGPTMTLAAVLEAARRVAAEATGREAPAPRHVPDAVLAANGISAWMGPASLPLWIDDPAWRYFATLDTRAARAQGLTTRPLEDTLRRVLAYEDSRTESRHCGLTDEDERRLRNALSAS